MKEKVKGKASSAMAVASLLLWTAAEAETWRFKNGFQAW
jgi:hypothetical protein